MNVGGVWQLCFCFGQPWIQIQRAGPRPRWSGDFSTQRNAVLGGTTGSSKTWVRYFTDMQVNLLTDSSPPTLASYIAIVQLLFRLCGNVAFAWALWEKQRLWFPVSTQLTPNLSTHSLTQTTPKTRVTRINSSQNIETCFTGLKSTFHCLQRCYGHFSSFCYYYYMTMTIIFTPASFGAG